MLARDQKNKHNTNEQLKKMKKGFKPFKKKYIIIKVSISISLENNSDSFSLLIERDSNPLTPCVNTWDNPH